MKEQYQTIVFTFCFIFLFGFKLSGQEGDLLTKNFKFKDGVYLSFSDFQENNPAFTWEQMEGNMVTNPQTFITKIEYLRVKGGRDLILREIWGVSIGGIPYIRIQESNTGKGVVRFAGLQVRGKICYFSFEEEEVRKIKVSAYNPINGRPFRTAEIPKKEVIFKEKMLDFNTGEIANFNVYVFQEWIKEDRQLWKTLDELSDKEADEKLFKCLLIFDDRHKVYIK